LMTLSSAILSAFDFYDDHLHSFFMNNRAWDGEAEYMCPGGDLDGALGYTDKVKLSKFRLVKGDKFKYVFDYGDDWRFQINVLRVVDEPTKRPVVLRSIGQISQYDDEEDYDYDDDYDFDTDDDEDDDAADEGDV